MKTWLIGSAPSCDVVIDEPTVSGKHCRLACKADAFFLEDLKSTNGTFVNGQRISSTQQVSQNDKIKLGRSVEMPWPATEPSDSNSNRPPTKPLRWSVAWILALAAITLGVVFVLWIMNHSTDATDSRLHTDSELTPSTSLLATTAQRTKTSPAVPSAFRIGTHQPSDLIRRIKVTLQIGADGRSVNGPIDLDLGAGFLLRLSAAKRDAPPTVAFPQNSSLDQSMTSIQAGTSASFDFSATAEVDREGRFSKTPQVLTDVSMEQIKTIRFLADPQADDWVLTAYKIEVNDQLYVANDSVHWRAQAARGRIQSDLKKLLQRQSSLDEAIQDADAYIKRGLGEASDALDLREIKRKRNQVAASIQRLQPKLKQSRPQYVEQKFLQKQIR